MLVVNTKESLLLNLHQNRVHFPAERNAFVLDHQHGRRDVTCKPAIRAVLNLVTFWSSAKIDLGYVWEDSFRFSFFYRSLSLFWVQVGYIALEKGKKRHQVIFYYTKLHNDLVILFFNSSITLNFYFELLHKLISRGFHSNSYVWIFVFPFVGASVKLFHHHHQSLFKHGKSSVKLKKVLFPSELKNEKKYRSSWCHTKQPV